MKEELIMDFINGTRLSELKNTDDILESFYKFARKEKAAKIRGLIEKKMLKEDSNRFIEKAISKGYTMIVTPSADPDLAVRDVVSSAFAENAKMKISRQSKIGRAHV